LLVVDKRLTYGYYLRVGKLVAADTAR